MFATRGPASLLPIWIQFLRLCTCVHNRKNWLHVGSERAGPKVAAILSVIETCRRLSLSVRDYLSEILPGLADYPVKRVSELTPAAWKARRG
jgi:hypothetical protein